MSDEMSDKYKKLSDLSDRINKNVRRCQINVRQYLTPAKVSVSIIRI